MADLKYNNADELQADIDKGVEANGRVCAKPSVDITPSDSDVRQGHINQAATPPKWHNLNATTGSFKMLIVDVSQYNGREISVSGSEVVSYKQYWAWLTSDTAVDATVVSQFLDGTGVESGFKYIRIVPTGAKYLYLLARYGSETYGDKEYSIPNIIIKKQASEIEIAAYGDKEGAAEGWYIKTFDVNIALPSNNGDLSIQDSEVQSTDVVEIRLPSNYDISKKCPFVVVFHGSGSYVDAVSGQSSKIIKDTVEYFNAHGYATIDVNGLPLALQFENSEGAGYGAPVCVQSYISAIKYAIKTYALDDNRCYFYTASMGSMPALNILQNSTIKVNAVALDAPLVSMENLWYNPTWESTGKYTYAVRFNLARMFGFSFDEVNEKYSTSYTLDTFVWDSGADGFSIEQTYDLYEFNRDKMKGFDPFTNNTVQVGDNIFQNYKCPLKIWRGASDGVSSKRIKYINDMIAHLKNGGSNIEARFPTTNLHVLCNSSYITNGGGYVTIGDKQYSCILEEVRLFFERYK